MNKTINPDPNSRSQASSAPKASPLSKEAVNPSTDTTNVSRTDEESSTTSGTPLTERTLSKTTTSTQAQEDLATVLTFRDTLGIILKSVPKLLPIITTSRLFRSVINASNRIFLTLKPSNLPALPPTLTPPSSSPNVNDEEPFTPQGPLNIKLIEVNTPQEIEDLIDFIKDPSNEPFVARIESITCLDTAENANKMQELFALLSANKLPKLSSLVLTSADIDKIFSPNIDLENCSIKLKTFNGLKKFVRICKQNSEVLKYVKDIVLGPITQKNIFLIQELLHLPTQTSGKLPSISFERSSGSPISPLKVVSNRDIQDLINFIKISPNEALKCLEGIDFADIDDEDIPAVENLLSLLSEKADELPNLTSLSFKDISAYGSKNLSFTPQIPPSVTSLSFKSIRNLTFVLDQLPSNLASLNLGVISTSLIKFSEIPPNLTSFSYKYEEVEDLWYNPLYEENEEKLKKLKEEIDAKNQV